MVLCCTCLIKYLTPAICITYEHIDYRDIAHMREECIDIGM